MTTSPWRRYLFEILTTLLCTCICQVLSVDDKCKGSHKEITFPDLFIKNRLYGGQIPAREGDPVIFKFSWRGELLSAVLERHVITSGDGLNEWSSPDDNVTEAELLTTSEQFYQGYIRGKKFSVVALSISSSGLTGYIQLNREGVYIEPVAANNSRSSSLGPHVLRSCGHVATPRHDGNTRHEDEDDVNNGYTSRRRRAAPTRYLEVLLVADSKVVKAVGKLNVKTYLLTIMNVVNMLYHDPSLGTSIEVVTVKIKYMDSAAERRVIYTSDPKRTVDEFCHWVNYGSGSQGGSNHDIAVLMSRHGFAPAGYAPITGLCVPMRNCALVKDDGFTSSFVVAHEIAHVFGLMHDGHGNNCYGREYKTSIMATQVQSSFNNFWWSGCSKKRMSEVIGGLSCLHNQPSEVIPDRLLKPVGVSWTLDEQCRLEFGDPAKYCPFFGGRTPCTQLWCNDDTNTLTCKSKFVAPLDGTQCGPSPKWYCLRGQCGYHGNEKPLDGGWGTWSSWSNCSSKCGIGFMRRSRLCDNPEPKYNGKMCDGMSENTDTCKSKACTEYVDMRSQQCSSMDSAVVNGVTHRWLAYQVDNAADQCKLTCISEKTSELITFNSFVDNATPCSYEGPNGICINGKCETVGCDGIKGSRKREDRCGVCEGDGSSCKTVTGSFTKKFEYSAAGVHYEKVLELPKAARDVTIEEKTNSPHFLSVEDQRYYREIINAGGKQGSSKEFVLEGAWFRYKTYRGRETLTTTGPLHNPVNVLIYPMDYNKPADVHYSYTVDKADFTFEKNMFHWRFETWSPCSTTCDKGVQHIIYKCYDKTTDKKTDEEKCQHSEPPAQEDTECEMIECAAVMYGWRMKRDFTECSTTCGDDGNRHRQFECELFSDGLKVDPDFCVHIPKPIFPEACNRVPCGVPTFEWKSSAKWSECSKSCGDTGTQSQMFQCIEEHGGNTKEREDEFCADIKKPKEIRPCNRRKCIDYIWKMTDSYSPCNSPCGGSGTQKRKAVCQKFVNNKLERNIGVWLCSKTVKAPVETRECNRRACYRYDWGTVEQFDDCSHTCGDEGFKSKQIVCKNVTYDDRERNVDDIYCKADDRPVVLEACNRVECDRFEWRVLGDWSPECQSMCTNNTTNQQSRNVVCYQIFPTGQQEQTDSLFCENGTRPDNVRDCPPVDCPMFVSEWKSTGDWSACSQTCGIESVQTEIYTCQQVLANGTTVTVNDTKCPSTKPTAEERACDAMPCARYKEDANAPWSDCSVTCETGVQYQQLTCVVTSDDVTDEVVPDEHCRNAGQELPGRPCNAGHCGFLEWEAGPWSTCSSTCGKGKQQREVRCGKAEDNADRSRCPGKAPSGDRDCDNGPCEGNATKAETVMKAETVVQPVTAVKAEKAVKVVKAVNAVQPVVKAPPTCVDRMTFCKRANKRLCAVGPYVRVCCNSCQSLKLDRKARSRRRRRLRTLRRSNRARRRKGRKNKNKNKKKNKDKKRDKKKDKKKDNSKNKSQDENKQPSHQNIDKE